MSSLFFSVIAPCVVNRSMSSVIAQSVPSVFLIIPYLVLLISVID